VPFFGAEEMAGEEKAGGVEVADDGARMINRLF
jgi:hypothetical protein